MIFATLDDMRARFDESELLQLTDQDGAGAIDEGRMGQALASASAIVEGYVAARYQVDTLVPMPLLLVDAACDVARFRLWRDNPPENVTVRNAQAVRTLEGVRAGRVKLDAGVESTVARDGVILSQAGERTMSRRDLRGW